jgi:nitrogen fixation protein NifZ
MCRRMPKSQDLHSHMSSDDTVELDGPPAYAEGDKVRSRQLVRNDGSCIGRRVGDLLIEKGETGFVRGIGSFLQRFYIYEVDFIERGVVVGMRAKELELVDAVPR